MLTINKIEEMRPYYNPKTNTCEFVDENNDRLAVQFDCDLFVRANIYVGNIVANGKVYVFNINAYGIKASDIHAYDIKSFGIKASGNIEYGAVCYAHNDIECKSIKSRYENGKHFSLKGEIKIIKDEPKPQEMTITEIEKILGKKIKIVNNKEN